MRAVRGTLNDHEAKHVRTGCAIGHDRIPRGSARDPCGGYLGYPPFEILVISITPPSDSRDAGTAIAARARGDREVFARCEAALVGSVRAYGCVLEPNGPEVARTAATVEGLEPFSTEAARAAAERAVGFLQRVQLAELGEPDHPDSIDGAFPLVPNDDTLRTDVAGHALLALLAWERRERALGKGAALATPLPRS